MVKYAVIRNPETHSKNFTAWHDSYIDAENEAVRLAKKEGTPFAVISLVSLITTEEVPVKIERYI
jgi:hypothetical protein